MRPYISLILALFILLPALASAQPYLIENSTWQAELEPVQWSSMAFGDVNNDNLLDLVLMGCNGGSGNDCSSHVTKIYVNNGTTLKEDGVWGENLTQLNRGSLALGDIDNDGDLDLIITGCDSGGGVSACNSKHTIIYINNGTSFVENSIWKGDITDVYYGSIALGDVDNDGDLDLILTGAGLNSNKAKVYLSNGSVFLENQAWQQNLKSVYMSSVALGDIDNDEDLDLVLTGDFEGSPYEITEIYINNGTTFTEDNNWDSSLLDVSESSVAFGDYDNDGDLDLTLIGHTTGDRHRVYENNGTNFIEVQKDVPSGGNLAGVFDGSVVFGDYNNDGYLDMIAMGHEGYTDVYIYNYSMLPFTSYEEDPESQIDNVEYGPSCAWADLNNDNKLDLALTGWLSPAYLKIKIYINNITSSNNNPNPPNSNFKSNFSFLTGKLTLNWDNGSDTETPTLGLYYNLRIGTCSGCHDVISDVFGGSSNPTAGYFGNMMQRKSITLNRPDLENKTIYWAVQTIDTGLAKSEWSEEQVFEIVQAPPPCIESWTYGEWSSCINGQQTRSATDLNNCGTFVNRSIITRSCTSGTSGPSGPSGPVIMPPEEKKKPENATEYFERILAGVDTGVSLDESGLAIHQVWVKVKNEVREVSVFINKLDSKPALVTNEPEEKVYQYLNITYTNIQDEEIVTGKIYFNVEKGWIEDNSINKSTVFMLRYRDNEWQKLKTEIREEYSEYVHYQADTPGFSIFAIAGKVLVEAGMVCVPMERKCENEKLLECSIEGNAWMLEEVCEYGCAIDRCKEQTEEPFWFGYMWLAIPLTLIIIVIALYFSKIRKTG